MHEKLEKVKTHFQENKKLYIGIAVGASVTAIAAVSYVLLSNKGELIVNNKPVQILTWKSKQTIEVHIEALGDPGNIIQDLTTGIVYASQNQAARELGVNPARISEHLAGKLDNVKGHAFSMLGKAHVS